MKRLIAVLIVAMAVATPVLAAQPVDDYDDSQSHPLRVAAYLVHPVGYAVKWAIFQPIHWVVAQPGMQDVFGHDCHQDYVLETDCIHPE